MTEELADLLDTLPSSPQGRQLGDDMNRAHEVLLADVSPEVKRQALMDWLARSQPCLFGRIAAHERGLPRVGVCWIKSSDLDQGVQFVTERVQAARRIFKDQAARGEISGFLVMFNDQRLALAKPSVELLGVCKLLCGCLLSEQRPIRDDHIYTESMPLELNEDLMLFKASCTLFTTSAHDTVFHDHRVPGGVLLNINAVGHYAWSLVLSGVARNFEEAVEQSRELAVRSIGNGGQGMPDRPSSTRHLHVAGQKDWAGRRRPSHVPVDADRARYCADYHSDVFIPSAAVSGEDSGCPFSGAQWPNMLIDYLTADELAEDHYNYALMRGHPAGSSDRYATPWGPTSVTPEDEIY